MNINFDILEFIFKNDQLKIHLFEFNPKIFFLSKKLTFNENLLNEINKKIDELLENNEIYSSKPFLNLGIELQEIFNPKGNLIFKKILNHISSRKKNLLFLIQDKKNKIQDFPLEIIVSKKKNFLWLNRSILRSYSYFHKKYPIQSHKEIRKSNTTKKPSLLIISDPLSNLKHSYNEGLSLYKYLFLNLEHVFDKIDFISKPIKKKELTVFFNDYSWIHYTGHGQYDYENKQYGIRCHENEIFTAKDMTSLKSPCEFIFFNACYLSKKNKDNSGSFIYTLLEMGIQNIIASSKKIVDDKNHIYFVLRFYKNLLFHNLSFEKALFKTGKSFHKKNLHIWLYYNFYQSMK